MYQLCRAPEIRRSIFVFKSAKFQVLYLDIRLNGEISVARRAPATISATVPGQAQQAQAHSQRILILRGHGVTPAGRAGRARIAAVIIQDHQ